MFDQTRPQGRSSSRACHAGRVSPPPLKPGDAAASASANIADNLSAGPHRGFDTFAYPSDDAMHAWATADKPYRWVGYYLSAPCHSDSSWEGKRETLSSMG